MSDSLDEFLDDDVLDELMKEFDKENTTKPTQNLKQSSLLAHFGMKAGLEKQRHFSQSMINRLQSHHNFKPFDYIYPVNYSLRDYQYSIVQCCLLFNTLVWYCLILKLVCQQG